MLSPPLELGGPQLDSWFLEIHNNPHALAGWIWYDVSVVAYGSDIHDYCVSEAIDASLGGACSQDPIRPLAQSSEST